MSPADAGSGDLIDADSPGLRPGLQLCRPDGAKLRRPPRIDPSLRGQILRLVPGPVVG